jgi:DNA (cytosine-5)-methyltransferase 1
MLLDTHQQTVNLPDWINVDLFAGGGGASTGMKWALGKSPDIAINHDPEALAMHKANHPDTYHICQDLMQVHPRHATYGRKVNILWASPDCTHFSKAKGGKPRDQSIRDLAWVVIRWAEETRPRYIFVENVEEFKTWGPLDKHGQPIKSQSGTTFAAWVKRLRRLGYRVDYRELRACDYGAPTTRKRLFIVARFDGHKICWPQATHGPGAEHPWHTAAECIDWDDRAPSIFERKKPLAMNTQRRIAEGIRRYVLKAEKPFLVTYYGAKRENDFRGQPVDEPLRTQTTENRHSANPNFQGQSVDAPLGTVTQVAGHALTIPYLVNPNHKGENFRGQGIDEPIGTMTGKGSFCLTAPFMTKFNTGSVGYRCDEPVHTIIAGGKQARPGTAITQGLVSACLVGAGGPKYAGKPTAVDKPLNTITADNHKALAAASLVKMRGTNIGGPVDAPLQTISAQGTHHAVCAASLCKYYGEGGQHNSLDDPMHTSTSKNRFALQTAHLQQYNGCSAAQPLDEPMPTVPTHDRFGLTAAILCQYNGRSECQPLNEPAPTLLGENKIGLVQCSLSPKNNHYEEVRDFLRFWKVIGPDEEAIVVINGITYLIVDIGLRMLRPRELFTANGFPLTYVIDPIYNGKPLNITSQVKKCGNSVPPEFAYAIITDNYYPPSETMQADKYAGFPRFAGVSRTEASA